jgi:hypothetical protein
MCSGNFSVVVFAMFIYAFLPSKCQVLVAMQGNKKAPHGRFCQKIKLLSFYGIQKWNAAEGISGFTDGFGC